LIEREPLRREFEERYGRAPRLFRAPGRVNLIGEHTDYNGGFVLPMAIDRETIVAAAARPDSRVRLYSLNSRNGAEFDLDKPGEPRRGHWMDYVEGVAQALKGRGLRLVGADMLINSDVPPGSGLSSSAALEVSAGLALASLAGIEVDRVQLALAGQEAEHTYVGAKVGIMDQFIAALGRARHALLIDCRTLDAKSIPLDTTETVVAICDSTVRHELASSEYNTRRAECERGVELLRESLHDITHLRDVSVADFERHEGQLPEPIRRRCRHVVTENERTLSAADAFASGDLARAGALMNRSHDSLRDDYEVSCRELDTLVEIARSLGDGVLGSRMTGGGFGGSTVSLVRRAALEDFKQTIDALYHERTGLRPKIFVSEAGDGAGEIRNDE
jgi:galactokinase